MRKRIITISRQFGSGGRSIGKEVAKTLGIAYYDRELIEKVAEKTGLSPDFIAERGEYSPSKNPFAYSFVDRSINGMSLSDYLYNEQRRVILELADKEPCVIVGRCANYILRGRENVMNVFVTAPVVDCVRRVMQEDGLDLEAAEKKIKKIDKRRADYFKYFTGRQWHDAALYDLCLNTGHMPEEKCLEVVKAYMKARFEME